MCLDISMVEKISRKVYREFPETNGVRPSVSQEADRFVLMYRCRVSTPAGSLSRIVRVVASESGKILRMSTTK